MRALFIGVVLLASPVACGSSGKNSGAAPPGGAGSGATGGSAGVAGGGGSGSVERCPDGNLPSGADILQCPSTMPTGGTCCTEPGMACFYPGDETYRHVALCFDDPQHAPYWQETYALDRLECTRTGETIELGVDALACSERETLPCDPQGRVTPQELLIGQFDELVRQCGELPNESTLDVKFADGCASELLVAISGPADNSAPLLSCIEQALDATHFACADGLDCAAIERSTLRAK